MSKSASNSWLKRANRCCGGTFGPRDWMPCWPRLLMKAFGSIAASLRGAAAARPNATAITPRERRRRDIPKPHKNIGWQGNAAGAFEVPRRLPRVFGQSHELDTVAPGGQGQSAVFESQCVGAEDLAPPTA